MENIFYLFLRDLKRNDLPLNENEKNFVLYALVHSGTRIREDDIFCRVPLKDSFHILCNGAENMDELREKIDNIFCAFHFVLDNKNGIRYFNLLDRVSINSEKIYLIFNLKHIDLWVNHNESEAQKSLEDWIKDEVDKLVQKNKEEAGCGERDISEELNPNHMVKVDQFTTKAITCPVCGAEIINVNSNCPSCNFDEVSKNFANNQEHIKWLKEKAIPHGINYILSQKMMPTEAKRVKLTLGLIDGINHSDEEVAKMENVSVNRIYQHKAILQRRLKRLPCSKKLNILKGEIQN